MIASDKGFVDGGIYVATSDSITFSEGSLVRLESGVDKHLPLFKLIEGECRYNNAAGHTPGAFENCERFRLPEFSEFTRASAILLANRSRVTSNTNSNEETTTMTTPLTAHGFNVGDTVRLNQDRGDFQAGDIVKIIRDDGDSLPLVQEHGGMKRGYARIGSLEKVSPETDNAPENEDVKLERIEVGGAVQRGDSLVLNTGEVFTVDMDMDGPDSDDEYSVMAYDRGYVKVSEVKSAYRVTSKVPPKTEKSVTLTLSVRDQDLIEALEKKVFTPNESFEASYRRLTQREQILLAHLIRDLKESL